jgi:hypothetical protein
LPRLGFEIRFWWGGCSSLRARLSLLSRGRAMHGDARDAGGRWPDVCGVKKAELQGVRICECRASERAL